MNSRGAAALLGPWFARSFIMSRNDPALGLEALELTVLTCWRLGVQPHPVAE